MKLVAAIVVSALGVALGAFVVYRMSDGVQTEGGRGPADDPGFVSRAEFGARWPLTVDDGILRCRVTTAITFETGGIVYALNGNAEAFGFGRSIGPIWASAPDGRLKNLRPLIDRAGRLCR